MAGVLLFEDRSYYIGPWSVMIRLHQAAAGPLIADPVVGSLLYLGSAHHAEAMREFGWRDHTFCISPSTAQASSIPKKAPPTH